MGVAHGIEVALSDDCNPLHPIGHFLEVLTVVSTALLRDANHVAGTLNFITLFPILLLGMYTKRGVARHQAKFGMEHIEMASLRVCMLGRQQHGVIGRL